MPNTERVTDSITEDFAAENAVSEDNTHPLYELHQTIVDGQRVSQIDIVKPDVRPIIVVAFSEEFIDGELWTSTPEDIANRERPVEYRIVQDTTPSK